MPALLSLAPAPAPEFPLSVYETPLTPGPFDFTRWHWHEALQLCLVTHGRVSLTLHGEVHLLGEGEAILIGRGCLHTAKPRGGAAALLCIDFSPQLISGFPGSAVERRYVAPFLQDPTVVDRILSPSVPWQKDALKELAHVARLWEEAPFGWEVHIQTTLTRVWLALVEHRAPAPISSTSSRRNIDGAARAILTYLEEHYGEKITMEALARQVSFSPAECSRIFKRATGETIFTYLQSLRIAQSLTLLQTSQASVSEIGFQCGFSSTSYFILSFREKMGMTPLQYRKTLST